MSTKQKFAYIIAAVVVILAVGIGIFKVKKGGKDSQVVVPGAENQNNTIPPASETSEERPNVWTGILKESDNLQKGNLMLITSERTIYIRTSRDFSQLIEKRVSVIYEGTLDSFVLGSISEVKAD